MTVKNYRNKDWLENQYITQKKSTVKIGEEVGCSNTTISYWLKKFNIPIRTLSDALKISHSNPEVRKKISDGNKGRKAWNWNNGKRKSRGYMKVLKPNHLRADSKGYVDEHILVAEEMLGRGLEFYGKLHRNNEIVHHIDCNGLNNDPENLYICSKSKHPMIHNKFGHMTGELYKRGIIYFVKNKAFYDDKNKGEYYLNTLIIKL